MQEARNKLEVLIIVASMVPCNIQKRRDWLNDWRTNGDTIVITIIVIMMMVQSLIAIILSIVLSRPKGDWILKLRCFWFRLILLLLLFSAHFHLSLNIQKLNIEQYCIYSIRVFILLDFVFKQNELFLGMANGIHAPNYFVYIGKVLFFCFCSFQITKALNLIFWNIWDFNLIIM